MWHRAILLLLGGICLLLAACSQVSRRSAPMAGFVASPSQDVRCHSGHSCPPVVWSTPHKGADAGHRTIYREADSVSTFGLDLDTASYVQARRSLLQRRRLPPRSLIRTEDFINYFSYDDEFTAHGDGFGLHGDVVTNPQDPSKQWVRVLVQAPPAAGPRGPAHITLMIDVSGSMGRADKLPLLKKQLQHLDGYLQPGDRCHVYTYNRKVQRLAAWTVQENVASPLSAVLPHVQAAGGTNGGEALHIAMQDQAYEAKALPRRIILCTDGCFNVGTTSRQHLGQLVQSYRGTGVHLGIIGLGQDVRDAQLNALARGGNGSYDIVDSAIELDKVLRRNISNNLQVVAHDAKIQVFFNPRLVRSWRLLGYAERRLHRQAFHDPSADGGEIGAGQRVTAWYEIRRHVQRADVNPFVGDMQAVQRALPHIEQPRAEGSGLDPHALMHVRLRYRPATGMDSQLQECLLQDAPVHWRDLSQSGRWSLAMALFAEGLRGQRGISGHFVEALARGAIGDDPAGLRQEALVMLGRARRLASW